MNELTIEQLKALSKYDWVWIKYNHPDSICTGVFYAMKQIPKIVENPDNEFWTVGDGCYYYSEYGTKWVAYRNKQEAEAKGDIVELPCKVGDWVFIIDNDRHWAQIDTIRIHKENNGKQKITFEWTQYDIGVDVMEVWDSDEFDIEEFGKTVPLESIHGERIKELQAKEEAEYEAYAEEAERRLTELTKE